MPLPPDSRMCGFSGRPHHVTQVTPADSATSTNRNRPPPPEGAAGAPRGGGSAVVLPATAGEQQRQEERETPPARGEPRHFGAAASVASAIFANSLHAALRAPSSFAVWIVWTSVRAFFFASAVTTT